MINSDYTLWCWCLMCYVVKGVLVVFGVFVLKHCYFLLPATLKVTVLDSDIWAPLQMGRWTLIHNISDLLKANLLIS